MRTGGLALFIMLSLALPGGARAFEPGPSSPSAADLARRAYPEDEYAESMTYVAYFSDGSQAEAGFQVSNLGIGNNNGGFDAEVRAGGRVALVRGEAKHDYRWLSAPLTIEMGKADKGMWLKTIQGEAGQVGHTVEITAAAPDFGFRLRFRAITPAWRPASGRIRFGERFFDLMIQVPRAEVTGEVRAFGKTYQVHGQGYVEHGRTNADPRRHTGQQLRLRYFDEIDGQPLTALAYDHLTTPADGARRFGFLVVLLGDKVIYETARPVLQGLDLGPDPLRRQNLIPAGFQVAAGPEVQIHARVLRLVERYDYLDHVSGLLRAIIGHFLHPVSYNYDCAAQVTLGLPGLRAARRGWADCGISLTRP